MFVEKLENTNLFEVGKSYYSYACNSETLSDIADDILTETETINRAKIEMSSNGDFDPDNDPNGGKPDNENVTYSEFDDNFKACNIISVTFGGVKNAVEVPERKKITESEWLKLLEQKEIAENAARRERMQEIASQLVTAFENAHGNGVPLNENTTAVELLNVDDDGNIFEDLECWGIDVGGPWLLDIYSFIDGDFDNYTGKTIYYTIPQNLLEPAEPDPNQLEIDFAAYSANDEAETSAECGENELVTISENEWESIPTDYKAKFIDYYGKHPELKGRWTMMGGCLESTKRDRGKLLIEGLHFVIENKTCK